MGPGRGPPSTISFWPSWSSRTSSRRRRPAGERWARHWLDVARYTDSFDARGIGGEGDVPEAYRYRDWVVQAFNGDLPYDQFILNQFAGDLLPADAPGGLIEDELIVRQIAVERL